MSRDSATVLDASDAVDLAEVWRTIVHDVPPVESFVASLAPGAKG
jgi:hypothetical protein